MSWSGRCRRQAGRTGLRIALFLALSHPDLARAEVGQSQVSAGAKGTIGMTLLGAETVLVVEAAFGVKKPWLYLAGGAAGAIGGFIGGRYVDKAESGEASMTLLVAGLLFAIPTTIAVLNASAYKPPQNPVIDHGNANSVLIGSNLTAAHGMLDSSLVGADAKGNFGLFMPSIKMRPVFSKTTQKIYSLKPVTAYEIGLFGLTF